MGEAAGRRAQLFGGQPTTTKPYRHCSPFTLPSDGIIQIAPNYTITLTADTLFTPQCTSAVKSAEDDGVGGVTSIADMRDPFHASITPQAYATGAATVIAWMLVIMLLITPRTFFVGGVGGRSGLMGRRGMISGASGGGSIIGVGTRPWLQKVAALTVAISLTLATADTFRIAEIQYEEGYMDAMKLRDLVVGGMEIKVSRVVSDVFIWLAQVQTLIRLFPRHKEKVIIKWVGFALIVMDITFSSMNSFGPWEDNVHPRNFDTAIPALSYLFQLSLSMLYAAWVMYYAITKRRYAFYHSMMWNITLVALVSIVAILTPVIFFITDISNYTIAGWGDYFRWVGAAAASVIVWEWVERIEALEREERKDGILGREVYDGDDMLDDAPSQEMNWPRNRNSNLSDGGDLKKRGKGSGGGGSTAVTSGFTGLGFSSLARAGYSRIHERLHPHHKNQPQNPKIITQPPPIHRRSLNNQQSRRNSQNYSQLLSPPANIASPVSRTDTTSAESTVYTIRYHPVSDSPPHVRHPMPTEGLRRTYSNAGAQNSPDEPPNQDPEKGPEETPENIQSRSRWHWQAVANPFRRRGRSPPPEVQRGRVIEPFNIDEAPSTLPPHHISKWDVRARLGAFAAEQGEKYRTKRDGGQQVEANLPVTIIPAQPRGRTWSPEVLQQQQEQEFAAAGLTISRDPPPTSNPGNFEIDERPTTSHQGGSVTLVGTAVGSSQANANSTAGSSSHVRFTPETFQRPADREQEGDQAPTLPPVASPSELRPFTRQFTPPQTKGDSSRSNSPENTLHNSTNHDR